MKTFRILAICCFLLGAALGLQPAQAQSEQTTVEFSSAAQPDVEMADALRQDGKIYVVVVVLLTVLAGVLFYLISLDRKVSRLEKQLKDDFVNR
ncbi:CcmD family protein [Pontibacter sp. HJ8]